MYITSPRMSTAAGVRACWMDRDPCAIVRKIMDMVKVQVKLNRKKMKKGPASRRKFVMKYNGTLKQMAERTLLGSSVIMDEIASENGWYRA